MNWQGLGSCKRSVGVIECDHVTPCGLGEIYKRFKGTHYPHRQEITLNVGAQNYSKTRVNCHHVTWQHIVITLHGNILSSRYMATYCHHVTWQHIVITSQGNILSSCYKATYCHHVTWQHIVIKLHGNILSSRYMATYCHHVT